MFLYKRINFFHKNLEIRGKHNNDTLTRKWKYIDKIWNCQIYEISSEVYCYSMITRDTKLLTGNLTSACNNPYRSNETT